LHTIRVGSPQDLPALAAGGNARQYCGRRRNRKRFELRSSSPGIIPQNPGIIRPQLLTCHPELVRRGRRREGPYEANVSASAVAGLSLSSASHTCITISRMHPALNITHHRPWPLPRGPWIMQQIWNDLLFAHWPIAPEVMRPLVPSALLLDTFNGQCWIAVTPFHMSGIRPRWTPPLPGLSAFPELNVHTYVTHGGKGGVYFFSLDAGSRLAALAARATYHLPYFHAQMKVVDHNGWIEYH